MCLLIRREARRGLEPGELFNFHQNHRQLLFSEPTDCRRSTPKQPLQPQTGPTAATYSLNFSLNLQPELMTGSAVRTMAGTYIQNVQPEPQPELLLERSHSYQQNYTAMYSLNRLFFPPPAHCWTAKTVGREHTLTHSETAVPLPATSGLVVWLRPIMFKVRASETVASSRRC